MAAAMARFTALRGQTLFCRLNPIVVAPRAGYAIKKIGKGKGKAGALPVQQKKHYEDLETDPVKLTSALCGGNILKEGPDPALKADSEYPDWLWNMRLERKPVPLEDLDPDTKQYWKRVRKMHIKKTGQLQKTRSAWKIF